MTDLMQGPVYGLRTQESEYSDDLLPNFHYDDIFGTVVNRFIVQAVVGHPLTVFGKGGQTRGYLNLKDTLQCVELAVNSPVKAGELRILNQFTETFSVNELSEKIKKAAQMVGLKVEIRSIPNPRKEKEEHYYNPAHSGLTDLGLKPTLMDDGVLCDLLEKVLLHKNSININLVAPRVSWR